MLIEWIYNLDIYAILLLTGVLDCWNPRLYRSRNLFTGRLWERMRLVVFGGDYVRVFSWLSTVLLGIHP